VENLVFFTSTGTVEQTVPFSSVATPSLPICTKNAARWWHLSSRVVQIDVDVEIQQRAAEYSAMREAFSPRLARMLRGCLPEDNKQSALEQREKEGDECRSS
jgi:hypothetical protein